MCCGEETYSWGTIKVNAKLGKPTHLAAWTCNGKPIDEPPWGPLQLSLSMCFCKRRPTIGQDQDSPTLDRKDRNMQEPTEVTVPVGLCKSQQRP